MKRRKPGLLRFLLLLPILALLPATLSAQQPLCAKVKIEIKQEMTLERQAFEATMTINNAIIDTDLTNVNVVVNFKDKNGNPVIATADPNNTAASFFYKVSSLKNITDVEGTGVVPRSTTSEIKWLIIPAPGAGGANPAGVQYAVGATLTYKLKEVESVVEVIPDTIYVKPMPDLKLDYFIPNQVYADDPFTAEVEPAVPFGLGVRVANIGYGPANNLKIDSGQPKIVDNSQGLLINFRILGSEVNGQARTSSLLADFGTIAPQKAGVARWEMISSLSGRFTEFSASFSHSDALGGMLTSLIDSVNTHLLVHDVLVDVAGRDSIRDFLAKDGDIYKVYESEMTDTVVADLSASASFQNGVLSHPFHEGFFYIKLPDPNNGTMNISSVIKAGGKSVNSSNVWLSKTWDNNGLKWDHFINIFGYGLVDDPQVAQTYTFEFSQAVADIAPVIAAITDKVVSVNEQVGFTVNASASNGVVPIISANLIPGGSSFIDNHNGTGSFAWTPTGAGVFNITFEAKANNLVASRSMRISVVDSSTQPELLFTTANLDVNEDAGTVKLPVTLSKPSTEAVTVSYAATGGTAQDALDYTMPAGQLTFAPGEISKTITLIINEDDIEEGDENIQISLSSLTNAALGAVSVLNVVIHDNDQTGSLLVADGTKLKLFDRNNGTLLKEFVNYPVLGNIGGFTYGLDNKLYIGDRSSDAILRFDTKTGEYVDNFSSVPEIMQPGTMRFGNDGNLYVTCQGSNSIIKLDKNTGALLGTVTLNKTLKSVDDFIFLIDGTILVTSSADFAVFAFNPLTGDEIAGLVTIPELTSPASLILDPAGKLYVADAGKKTIYKYDLDTKAVLASYKDEAKLLDPVSMSLDQNGKLYVSDRLTAAIYRLGDDGIFSIFVKGASLTKSADIAFADLKPAVTGQPVDAIIFTSGNARFTVRASGTESLAYQWQQDNNDITGATSPVLDIQNAAIGLNGSKYSCIVSNYNGSVCSSEAVLTVKVPIDAIADSYQIDEDNVLTTTAQNGLFVNDVAEGAVAVLDTAVPVEQGVLNLNQDGTFAFTPALNFNGNVAFSYHLTKDGGVSGSAAVTIAVNVVDDAPSVSNAIANVAVDEDSAAQNIDLTNVFTDVDNDMALITKSVTGNTNEALIGAAIAENTLTLTPAANANGTATITIRGTSNGKNVDTSFTVTVNPVNDVPVAVADTATTDEDNAVTTNVLANDSDIDGDTLGIASVTQGAHGAVIIANGQIVYSPVHNFNGTDSFSYTIGDGNGGTAATEVTVTVNAVNDIPVANTQNIETNEDTAAAIVLAGTDVDGNAISFAIVTQPAHGVLSGTAPNLTYVPNADFNGVDSFTFKANDGNADSAVATVAITINAVDDAPAVANAVADVTVDEDAPASSINLADVFKDVDNDNALISKGVHENTNAALVNASILENTLTLGYVPNASGTSTITIRATSNGKTVDTNFTVTVNSVNDAPVANAQAITADEDVAVAIILAGGDIEGDTLAFSIVTQPAHGILSGTVPNLTYTPDANFNGTDSFTFKANDGNLDSAAATVAITVNAVDDAPVVANAIADLAVDEDAAPQNIDLSAVFSDIDNDNALIAKSVAGNTNGGLLTAVVSENTLTLSLAANANGTSTVTVRGTSNGKTVDASFAVTVKPVNDAPAAVADTATCDEDNAIAINVLANDTDVDGDTLVIASVTQGAHGAAVITGTNITYTPAANYSGLDTFTYAIGDGKGGTATAVVMVAVKPVNDAPVAYDDAAIAEIRANPESIVIDNLAGSLAINPSNSQNNRFSITTDSGQVIDLDYLSNEGLDYEYTGTASLMDVKSKGQGRTIVINGTDLDLTTTPRFTFEGVMSVHIWNENQKTKKKKGSWMVEFSGTQISITPAPDGASALQGPSVAIDVLSNDTDLEGDTLSVASVTEPQNGTVVINDDGTVTYKANPGFTGSDSFEYTVSDGNGGTDTGTVAVGVISENSGAAAAAFDSIEGDLNIGSTFTMEPVAGNAIDMKTLSKRGAAYQYSGTVSELKIMVREQGKTIAVNGIEIELKTDLTYVFTGDILAVLANRNPNAVQTSWWINISGQNISISLAP
ncbi:MAG: hypothetical protein A2X45_13360 [Lentisphaerae bacterium GWF2_50_93]|nr:MAG: hypothetical protein A2X45_13360 [Lentisphaerae bacterium GWF2_50_93]